MQSPKLEPRWQKTNASGIVRYVPTGSLYSRVKVGGKLINRSLRTTRVDIAKARLSQLVTEERTRVASKAAYAEGLMRFGDAAEVFKNRLADDPVLKPRSKEYRVERLAALLKSWPDLSETDVRRITKHKVLEWAARFRKYSSPTAFNNTVSTLRMVLGVAIEAGAIVQNPVVGVKRVKEVAKAPQLPANDAFLRLLNEVESVNRRYSKACADLIRFLAFGGFRKSEAKNVTWSDCDFVKEEILIRGDENTGTKNWTVRRIPMIPDMKALLQKLRTRRPTELPTDKVMTIAECQGAITRACSKLGIARFTHHDLRHLFATRCIESDVDIPTVAKWLGHKDGGALLMKTYSHLRDRHSSSMAQKVRFSEVSNAV